MIFVLILKEILPNFLDYVNYASKYNCRFGIITNLNKRDDLLWEELVKKNFWFGVSFDAARKKTFEYIKGISSHIHRFYNGI